MRGAKASGTGRAGGYGLVAAFLVAAMGASHRAGAEGFSTTNAQVLYGWGFRDRKFGMDTTTGRMATIRLNHYSTWLYGDNYFFVDMYRGDFVAGQPPLSHMYAQWGPRFFVNKLLGVEGNVLGIFRDFGLAAQVNQSGNAFYAYLAGVGGNFALPPRYRLALNLFYRRDRFDGNEWQVSPFWFIPFRIAAVQLVATGFIDIFGSKDLAGSQSFDFVAQPELRIDVLALFGRQADTLFIGAEWFVHRFPSGPYGPGRVVSAPELLVQWTFAGTTREVSPP
jgi:hypothetical protein